MRDETSTMKCPTDGMVLVLSDRSGIEIDYCPECRGVWLDRGELDKIIERSAAQPEPDYGNSPDQYSRGGHHGSSSGSHNGYGGSGSHNGYGGTGRRRRGWLGELFD